MYGDASAAATKLTDRNWGALVELRPSHRSTDEIAASLGAPRRAVACLAGFACIDVLNTIAAVADYEDAIAVVTHGASDVPGALEFRALLDLIGPHDVVTRMIDALWLAGFLVTVAAVTIWLLQLRRNADQMALAVPAMPPAPAAAMRLWWRGCLVTLVLNGLIAANQLLVRGDERHLPEVLDTRAVTYPLWTAATVAVVATAIVTGGLVRRLTTAQL